jgi:hypothetical protein
VCSTECIGIHDLGKKDMMLPTKSGYIPNWMVAVKKKLKAPSSRFFITP